MAKLFDHAVIYNGVYYPANTPIEDGEAEKAPKAEVKAPEKEVEAAPKKEAVKKNDKRTSKSAKLGDSD